MSVCATLLCGAMLVCMSLVLSGVAFAQDKAVGTAVKVVGKSEILNERGESRQLRIKDRILSGDTIITKDEGWVTINFYDLTRIVIRPDSRFRITEFPETRDAGKIKMEMLSGGARVTTGTIANQSLDRFSLSTPNGLIQASRAEWVVRVCEGDSCDALAKEIRICERFQKPESANKQFVSVYKGEIAPAYCSPQTRVKKGESAISDSGSVSCKLIEEVPCFILFDKSLGRDKARELSKNLKLAPGYEHDQGRPPPRRERPSHRGEHRRPPPGARPPPRRAPRR